MGTGYIRSFSDRSQKGFIENLSYEGRFTRTAYAGYYRHNSKGESDVDILKIVFGSPFDLNEFLPRASVNRSLYPAFATEIIHGVRYSGTFPFDCVIDFSLKHNFSSESSGIGTYIDYLVGSKH